MFFSSSIFRSIPLTILQKRCLHEIHHNINRQIFYVKLNSYDRAVLLYKKTDNILDMQSLKVPAKYEGQGIAKRLAETAFTYAIVNNYFLVLTCPYMQKIYINKKTPELESLVIGPPHLLGQP